MKLAIFASGNGANFEEIVKATQEGVLDATIACLICDRADAYVLKRAKRLAIPYYVLEPKHFLTKIDYEKQVLYYLNEQEIEFIVLAGYMRLIGNTLLLPYLNRIVNLHPSLLPEYAGKDSIQRAFDENRPYSGITIHFIDQGMDTGPIIFQKEVTRYPEDTLATFEARIHQVEYQYYPKIIQQVLKGESIHA